MCASDDGASRFSASSAVGNGTKATNISRSRFRNSSGLSTTAITWNSAWWFTHMMPITAKLTAYAK
jgi:hypothetical protein